MFIALIKYLLVHPATIALVAHFLVVTFLVIRVIMRKPPVGVALAWVLLISATPFFGAIFYMLVGERRIDQRRFLARQALSLDYREISEFAFERGLLDVRWENHSPDARAMNHLGISLRGFPTVQGSDYTLYSDTDLILGDIARDIDSAQQSVLIEFYIWNKGGLADDVLNAVIRASERGVYCCLLIDALGARPWWKSDQPKQLRDAGVHLRQAMPVGLFRGLIGRQDLRMHRKIVVVDGKVGWTGSLNMVDPKFFKQDAGVGEWIDAMVRLQGSAVSALAAVMIGDWIVETGEPLTEMVELAKLKWCKPQGDVDMQVIASGPGQSKDLQLQMILALLNSAHQEVVLTTPYLVPDESLMRALRCVAAKGVRIRLVVPEKVDSLLVRHASRSYFDELLECGIEIYLYREGLIHTKSITVDDSITMFGSVNLDMRSLWLNYEMAIYAYNSPFTRDVRSLQQSYIELSDQLDRESWAQRSYFTRLLENSFRLTSPLL